MARKCKLSGKAPLVGNNVSHANNKSKRRQLPNLQNKRIFVSELNRFVRIKISTRALKTVNSKGLMTYLSQQGLKLADVEIS
jgi:large subunit ribosomal protein L28